MRFVSVLAALNTDVDKNEQWFVFQSVFSKLCFELCFLKCIFRVSLVGSLPSFFICVMTDFVLYG